MTRSTRRQVGMTAWGLGVALGIADAGPVRASDFSIGGLFASGRHGGTVIGGFLRIGEPRPVAPLPVAVAAPVVVPPPVVTERIWVSTPRVEYREVPVLDTFGRVIAYRQESVVVPDGHWEYVTRPAPVVVAPPPPPPHRNAGFAVQVRVGGGNRCDDRNDARNGWRGEPQRWRR